MSLDFDVGRVKNFEVITTLMNGERSEWHPVTKALTFATMAIDLGSITEANWQAFHNRLNMWERMVTPFLYGPAGSGLRFITPTEVYSHIGLRTNVIDRPLNAFLKKLYNAVQRDNEALQSNGKHIYNAYEIATMNKEQWQKLWQGEFGTTLEDRLIATQPLLDPTNLQRV